MSDRRQVVFTFPVEKDEESRRAIYLYSHWSGFELPQKVQSALGIAKSRWTDEPYFTRIMLTNILPPADPNDLLSWGIAPYYMDTEYDDVIICMGENTVSIGNDTWSFEEYLSVDFEKENIT